MSMSKNKLRKVAFSTIAASTAVAAVAPAVAADSVEFPDVKPGNDGYGAVGVFYDSIMKLAEDGIVTGDSGADGKFRPWDNVVRGQVAKMLTNATGAEIPEDIADVLSAYNDVNENNDYAEYIAAVTKAGIFGGSNGNFMEYEDLTREQMAAVLVRAFDLEELNEGVEDVAVNLDHVSDGFEGDIQIIANLGITTELSNPRAYDKINRAEFATMLDRTMEVAGYHDSDAEAAIEDVSAINAKTLKVEFNKAVNVKEEDFKVNKGSVSSNISGVKLSKDMESAEIELTSKLTEGEYTVTVERSGKDNLTGSVKVAGETVEGIEVLSDVAPVEKNPAGEITGSTIAYQVTNQYGEDVTKLYGPSLEINISGSSVTNPGSVTPNADGTIEFTLDNNKAKVGDKVNITLIDKETGVSTTKQIELSEEAVADEATFGELYNKDDIELDEDTNTTDNTFYLPITVKDQYGNQITDVDKANEGLVISNTNPGVLSFVNDLGNSNDAEIKEVSIDDKDVLVLEVKGDTERLAGTTNVLAISKNTGESAQTSVKVSEGVKIATVSLGKPAELVTANKDIYFPLSLTDTNGDDITTLKEFNKLNKKDALGLPDNSSVVEKDEGLFVKYTGTVEKDKPVTLVLTTSTGKVATQTVTPQAEAVPTVITGLKDDVSTALRETDGTVTIDNTDLIVEDQYGQVMADNSDLKFTVDNESEQLENQVFTVSQTDQKSATITADGASNKDSEKLTFTLDDASNVDASAFTKKFSVVKDSEFSSYSIEDVNPVFVTGDDESGYNATGDYQSEISVKAKTKSGQTVDLKNNEYTVKSSSVEFNQGDKKITGINKNFGDKDTVTGTITVTINETGDEVTQDVKFSTVAPTTEKLEAREGGEKDGKVINNLKVTSSTVNADSFDGSLYFVDQYGVSNADSAVATSEDLELTFTKPSPAKGNAKLNIVSNGTGNAEITNFEVGDSVTVKVTKGDQSVTLKVSKDEEAGEEAPGDATDADKVAADVALVDGESFEIPLVNQSDQEAKTAWVQEQVDALLENGTTATVTYEGSDYKVKIESGSESDDTATITVTEEEAQ